MGIQVGRNEEGGCLNITVLSIQNVNLHKKVSKLKHVYTKKTHMNTYSSFIHKLPNLGSNQNILQ